MRSRMNYKQNQDWKINFGGKLFPSPLHYNTGPCASYQGSNPNHGLFLIKSQTLKTSWFSGAAPLRKNKNPKPLSVLGEAILVNPIIHTAKSHTFPQPILFKLSRHPISFTTPHSACSSSLLGFIFVQARFSEMFHRAGTQGTDETYVWWLIFTCAKDQNPLRAYFLLSTWYTLHEITISSSHNCSLEFTSIYCWLEYFLPSFKKPH